MKGVLNNRIPNNSFYREGQFLVFYLSHSRSIQGISLSTFSSRIEIKNIALFKCVCVCVCVSVQGDHRGEVSPLAAGQFASNHSTRTGDLGEGRPGRQLQTALFHPVTHHFLYLAPVWPESHSGLVVC